VQAAHHRRPLRRREEVHHRDQQHADRLVEVDQLGRLGVPEHVAGVVQVGGRHRG
jgi:hypothetical protein